MKKIITAFIFIITVGFSAAAQETVSFADYIAEDGSGIEKLQRIQKKRADKKEVYTTLDTVSDACELVDLITVLLDKAVMKKVRELPRDQGQVNIHPTFIKSSVPDKGRAAAIPGENVRLETLFRNMVSSAANIRSGKLTGKTC